MKKLIINMAPTGIIANKRINPSVPESPEEIVSTVIRCAQKGVSIVHLHARDDNGFPTYKKEIYKEIISGIRAQNPQLVITVSTSGRTFADFDKRSEVLKLENDFLPDMGSLTMGSFNFNKDTSINSNETIINLAMLMKERGIKPELEIFDLGMLNLTKYLIKKNILEPPFYFNLFLGNISTAQAKLLHAGLMVSELPPNSYYSFAGFGEFQKYATMLGIISADGVRIGLEDNIWHSQEKNILTSNENLVDSTIGYCQLYDREIASPREVRAILGLNF